MTEVAIVGGGVMGCAIALELATRGVAATVLERSVPGAEASSAAAGMLGAQLEVHADTPFLRLCLASRDRFAALADALREITGIDVEFRQCGALRVATHDDGAAALEREHAIHVAAGLEARLLDRAEVRGREPSIGDAARAGLLFARDGRIDPPTYLRALRIAAERKGARFSSGRLVKRIAVEGDRARGVELEDGEILEARHVVVAAGSWSGLIAGASIGRSTVKPARGQIAELRTTMPLLEGIISSDRVYLSPRDDGRVIVGSTLEFVGFEKRVTAGAIAELLTAAIALCPALADAEFTRSWANFRPYTSDELPLVGKTATEGLILATGHYRNGILLSPITAAIVASIVEGAAPPLDISAFSPLRGA